MTKQGTRKQILKALVVTAILVGVGPTAEASSLLGEASRDSLSRQFESVRAEEVSIPSDADLDFYLALAMRRSPALRRAFFRWQAAIAKSGYAGALPDPMVSFTYFVENVETRVGPQEKRVGLRQSFPWFGTLGAKKDIASEMANAEYRNLESARLKLSYDVKSAYYDYYYIGRDLQITKDNMELLSFWESVAQSKYKVGLKQHPDVIKAQVELGKLEDRVRTLEEMLVPAAARLQAAANLPDSLQLPLPQSATVLEFELRRDSVVSSVRRNNPDLAALNHLVDKEEAGIRLAGKLARPSFTIGLDYILTGEAINPALAESGKDPLMVGAMVSLPIWFGKNSARNDEARARLRVAEYTYEDKHDRLVAYTEKVLFNYSDALRKTRLYRDGLVPKAEQSLNASYASYQAGETDFLNVLDAQRQLLDFELTVEQERVRLGKTAAEVEMLTGYNLEQFEK